MTRVFLFLIAVFYSIVSIAIGSDNTTSKQASEERVQVAKYLGYFKELNLPYTQPRGCSEDRRCSLVSDFNGDGIPDLAGLYEYSGTKKRGDNWYLDLVIIFSSDNSIRHEIISYVGQINNGKEIIHYLEQQGPGIMELIPGSKSERTLKLDNPAINIRRESTIEYFPTIYWNGRKFIGASKVND